MHMIPKVKPFRSPKYRKWILTLPCVVCGIPSAHAHHEQAPGHGTMGGKCGDDRCLPLCACHHDERHRKGRSVWKRWGIEPERIIKRIWGVWEKITGKEQVE